MRLAFDDGTAGEVDFTARRWDGDFLAQVRVDREAGTIAWPNGVDMAPEPL
jgi:hypothetical protein